MNGVNEGVGYIPVKFSRIDKFLKYLNLKPI